MKIGKAISRFSIAWLSAKMPVVGLVASILFASGMVGLTLHKAPTPFEAGFLQFLILLTGIWGSRILGKESALQAAQDMIRPQAGLAFKRVLALYESLRRLSIRIEELKEQGADHRLDLVQALVNEQIWTGKDAVDDWRAISPDGVKEIERRYGLDVDGS